MSEGSGRAPQPGGCVPAAVPTSVDALLRENQGLAEANRLQAQTVGVLSALLAERRVWLVMAGGRHGTLVGGPYGSAEDAEAGREALIEEPTADGHWGRIHPDAASAGELYSVHEHQVMYPLGWTEE